MYIQPYLERIGYTGSVEPTLETLRGLHRSHLMAVPFENLSIHMGQPIVLQEAELYDKIVNRRRGGFCYELNGLFAWALRTLGYDVTLLSAGVANSEGVIGPDFDHLTLRVNLDQLWLADVGFGESFLEPIPLNETICPTEPNYRVINEAGIHFMQQKDKHGEWHVQYRFSLIPRQFSDFGEMCAYQQTSPESHFTRNRICTLARADGRITLSNLKMIVTRDGKRSEIMLPDEEAYGAALQEYFGMMVTQPFRAPLEKGI